MPIFDYHQNDISKPNAHLRLNEECNSLSWKLPVSIWPEKNYRMPFSVHIKKVIMFSQTSGTS